MVFTKYVAGLNFDGSPDYEKCRKEFNNGLKALGKTNTGDLEFKSSPAKTTSPSAKENVKPSARAIRSPIRPQLSNITEHTENDTEPPKKRADALSRPRKRVQTVDLDSSDEEVSPPKARSRGAKTAKTTNAAETVTPSSARNTPSLKVNNEVAATKSGKTYQLNFELDISFDANVVVNVKRKPRKAGEAKNKKAAGPSKKKLSIQSTDEIPATEQSFAVGSARVLKKTSKPTKTSPRSHK